MITRMLDNFFLFKLVFPLENIRMSPTNCLTKNKLKPKKLFLFSASLVAHGGDAYLRFL